MRYHIAVTPQAAVRMTQRGKWVKPSAMKYIAYKSLIRSLVTCSGPTLAAVGVKIKFIMPIPESWSQKKKVEAVGKHHTKKPDVDNLIKGLFDSLNGLIWKDDNQVCDVQAVKVYGNEPGIEIEITELF